MLNLSKENFQKTRWLADLQYCKVSHVKFHGYENLSNVIKLTAIFCAYYDLNMPGGM